MTTTFALGRALRQAGPGGMTGERVAALAESAEGTGRGAACGAGVARRLPGRGSCSRCRRDRFQRAHARPGAVPGGTDFLSGGIHVQRTGHPLPLRLVIRAAVAALLSLAVLSLIPGQAVAPALVSWLIT